MFTKIGPLAWGLNSDRYDRSPACHWTTDLSSSCYLQFSGVYWVGQVPARCLQSRFEGWPQWAHPSAAANTSLLASIVRAQTIPSGRDRCTCMFRCVAKRQWRFHPKLLFFVTNKGQWNAKSGPKAAYRNCAMRTKFPDVWRRNKSVRAEIGQILRTHTHTRLN